MVDDGNAAAGITKDHRGASGPRCRPKDRQHDSQAGHSSGSAWCNEDEANGDGGAVYNELRTAEQRQSNRPGSGGGTERTVDLDIAFEVAVGQRHGAGLRLRDGWAEVNRSWRGSGPRCGTIPDVAAAGLHGTRLDPQRRGKWACAAEAAVGEKYLTRTGAGGEGIVGEQRWDGTFDGYIGQDELLATGTRKVDPGRLAAGREDLDGCSTGDGTIAGRET